VINHLALFREKQPAGIMADEYSKRNSCKLLRDRRIAAVNERWKIK